MWGRALTTIGKGSKSLGVAPEQKDPEAWPLPSKEVSTLVRLALLIGLLKVKQLSLPNQKIRGEFQHPVSNRTGHTVWI